KPVSLRPLGETRLPSQNHHAPSGVSSTCGPRSRHSFGNADDQRSGGIAWMSRWSSAEISTCSAGTCTALLLLCSRRFRSLRTLLSPQYKSNRYGRPKEAIRRRRPMNAFDRDFFTDPEILQDPVPYYRALHERGPVVREPHKGVFMLSRIDEI